MNKKSIANISYLKTETQRRLSVYSFKPIYFLYTMLKLMCVDPSLGRLDYESLSEQALMEMLTDGMDEGGKSGCKDDTGNFLDVCERRGVGCVNSRVHSVTLYGKKFSEKQIPFTFLPPFI